ncbi:MAG: EF-P beta-lysylation protein EpmB [Gammaproteobacteria bacterium]|nr:EF-P beta-lysylation protein EpmB [Gammaproteobacteria bacterium]
MAQLLEQCDLPVAANRSAEAAAAAFSVRVPQSYLRRMVAGDRDDPLLRQVLPQAAEMEMNEGYSRDPVGDIAASPLPGLIHKYHGRILLLITASCPIHCRFCFRRHFPYRDHELSPQQLESVVNYLRLHPEIHEVIFSGGDPLMASTERLLTITTALLQLPQLRRLRIHSRLPIVAPERLSEELITGLGATRLSPVMVVHCNHPHELTAEVIAKLAQLSAAGWTLFNQSVLLKGVNDCAKTLIILSEALFAAGVLPYYLHILDKALGVAHFAVPNQEIDPLLHAMRSTLPGYLMPKVVTEVAAFPYKQSYYYRDG